MRSGLQVRLFISHLVVMLVGLGSFITISNLTAHRTFLTHLDRMKHIHTTLTEVQEELLKGFEIAWNRSTIWALVPGGLSAAALSYWVSRRITQPLFFMERTASSFAAGDLNARFPSSDIPELARLSASFNHMAVSLQHVEEHRRDLMGELTHELRTPLTIVRSYLEEVAEEQRILSPDTAQLLVRETGRLERLVTHLQDFSKLETGQLPLHCQPIVLTPVFDRLVQRFASQVPEDGPSLSYRCSSHVSAVLTDPDRLEQILVNLLGNALQHTSGGTITLKAWDAEPGVWIAVEDTGCGIAPEELPHIFDRFWRSPRTAQKSPHGMGIGLTLTQRLVTLLGGKIEVESTLGQGSIFRFSLPKA